ncbi:hypothetical protein [Pseudorhodoferax sp.]|uniref:hypothetical protein n=1 Tax=Pseudorhodoferax sp. TaxID=1993553 RepID=UPI002DD6372C|nr:hypothetical protein [Pseudorhodoferax sp.]
MKAAGRSTSKRASPTAVKLAQLGTAAPVVIAHRLTRMALAGPVPSARDRKEFTGMVAEKQLAFTQAWMGMAGAALQLQQQWLFGCLTGRLPSVPQALDAAAAKSLAPIHRKAVSNARRLARTRLR